MEVLQQEHGCRLVTVHSADEQRAVRRSPARRQTLRDGEQLRLRGEDARNGVAGHRTMGLDP